MLSCAGTSQKKRRLWRTEAKLATFAKAPCCAAAIGLSAISVLSPCCFQTLCLSRGAVREKALTVGELCTRASVNRPKFLTRQRFTWPSEGQSGAPNRPSLPPYTAQMTTPDQTEIWPDSKMTGAAQISGEKWAEKPDSVCTA